MTIETDTWLDLVVARRFQESTRIVSLDLVSANGEPLPPFEAGAHIDIKINDGLVRQYSLCNDPKDRARYRIGVLLEESSRGGSKGIHETFSIGHHHKASVPRNAFHLDGNADHYILLGGGIGITPLISMAFALHERGASFELHYCFRTSQNAAFSKELAGAPFGKSVFLHADDGPESQVFSAQEILKPRGRDSRLYFCGPAGFLNHVRKTALYAGWDAAHLREEAFTLAPPNQESFTVVAQLSGVKVEVRDGERISDALERVGIAVNVSCQAGVCGTCLTRVLEGVPDHRDILQTDNEKASNQWIALCCSGSKSTHLVLDI